MRKPCEKRVLSTTVYFCRPTGKPNRIEDFFKLSWQYKDDSVLQMRKERLKRSLSLWFPCGRSHKPGNLQAKIAFEGFSLLAAGSKAARRKI